MTDAANARTDHSVAGADWFQAPQLHAVFAALNRDGHEARIVGGALRNTLMGLPVGDIDFAVTASPEEVIDLAEQAGFKAVPTGIDHGTITVVSGHMPFEVTTLRQDVETHGRHATVAFTKDWAADAARRDFTINALYAGADGAVYDPLGGLPDLHARRVRFIGSAHDRIEEDYLRILRFFRFTADYSSGPPDPEGLTACIRARGGLAKLSAERVRVELLRILVTRTPLLALTPMVEAGLLPALLAGVTRLPHFAALAELERRLELTPAPIRRLAALAVMVEEDAARLAQRLRLSNAEAGRLRAMAAIHPALTPETSERAVRLALYRLGTDTFINRVLLGWARSESADTEPAANEGWRQLYELPQRWQPPVFPLKGQDLIEYGLEPGPKIGRTLRALENYWLAEDFAPSREALLDRLV